ncbi:leucine-rich repeat domain-containing protein [Dyadobacter sp. MSC1_007]|jgi:Leucine-rich repeat (LRR) protein|uniref:leucine-rich repeat domain-containing protein n=1 Tax=Dyadobacter sp. MSC1_007 TaxID=2909264 RepID=UPI002030EE93|nr:hypothetical protein [Dyadobacter sp. MSC1_007]
MVIRSLLIALLVTAFFGYSFTIGLTEPDSLIKKIPDFLAIPLLLACVLLYVLAAWWAVKGFSEHKFMAIVSLGFCAFGLSIFAVGFLMEMNSGKAAAGQYDYDFKRLDAGEKTALTKIIEGAGLNLSNATFTEHWHVADTTSTFRICVQKGHVTALNISNHPIRELDLFSQLPQLGDLYLRNCGLSDMSELKSTRIDRLDISDNQITNLETLSGVPNLRWLFASNNKLTSTWGLEHFKQLISKDLSKNPIDTIQVN